MSPPPPAAVMVREHVMGDAIQPQQCLVGRRVCDSSPCNKEHLGREVSGVAGTGPALQVAQDRRVVVAEQLVETFRWSHLPTAMEVQLTW